MMTIPKLRCRQLRISELVDCIMPARYRAALFFALLVPSLQIGFTSASFAQDKFSLVIGIDGLGYGTHGFSVASTPWLDSLIDGVWQPGYNGAYSDAGYSGGILGRGSQQPTVSGPGWSTMLTGVWTDRHAVTDNGSTMANGRYFENPPYLATVKEWYPELATATYINWEPIDTYIIHSIDIDDDPDNDVDVRETFGSDQSLADTVVNVLRTPRFERDVIFVAFDEVDVAGHAYGGYSDGYREKIEETDAWVGEILTAIASRPTFEEEDWQIVITSDHGHRPEGGHGGQTVLERTIPFIVAGKHVSQGALPSGVSHADIAPTVLDHFEIPIPSRYAGVSRADGAANYYDDFEGLALKPFTAAGSGGNGVIGYVPPENLASWVVQNEFLNGFECAEEAYNGWRVVDQDRWICEQNGQSRNLNGTLGNPGARNAVLLADPDAADDYSTGTGASPTNYNSWIHHDYDISSADLGTLLISLDYEFRCEDSQRTMMEVSFDGGRTYQILIDARVGSGYSDGEIENGPATFAAGIDFFPPQDADQLRLRFACIDAGNDWWFAVDNVSLDDVSGNLAFEDFEDLGMELFTVAPPCDDDPPPDDGTDFAGDLEDEIPGWTIDNSGMLAVSEEEAYNGWRAIDTDRWIEQQGSQLGRSKFTLSGWNNTILCADPDAFYDFVESENPPEQAFNSYVYRTYDLKGVDPQTYELNIDWEFAAFASQTGIIQVRFDNAPGGDWQTLLLLDSETIGNDVIIDDKTEGEDSEGRELKGIWSHQRGDFAACGSKMTVRVGCLQGGNDWWFAFDNVSVTGVSLGFLLGDASDDGLLNFNDLGPFALALTDRALYESLYPNVDVLRRLDMNCDGEFNFSDISGFAAEISGQ